MRRPWNAPESSEKRTTIDATLTQTREQLISIFIQWDLAVFLCRTHPRRRCFSRGQRSWTPSSIGLALDWKLPPCSGFNRINGGADWTCDLTRRCVEPRGYLSCSKPGSLCMCVSNSFKKAHDGSVTHSLTHKQLLIRNYVGKKMMPWGDNEVWYDEYSHIPPSSSKCAVHSLPLVTTHAHTRHTSNSSLGWLQQTGGGD